MSGPIRRHPRIWLAGLLLGALGLGLLVLLLVHPTSGRPASSSAPSPAAVRLAHLRQILPTGFSAPGKNLPPAEPTALAVAPVSSLSPSALHEATFPSKSEQEAILPALVDLPLPGRVHALFVSDTQPHYGEQVTVAAADLGPAPNHAALVILQGPGFRADHLVAVANGVAAFTITLPSRMATGTWYLVVQDLSEVTEASPPSLGGTVLIDIGSFTVH